MVKLNILTNRKKNNHFSCLKKMAAKADTLIIVSPFVTDDISKLIENMTTIKNITLYTTLQKYDDTAQKVIALYNFFEYCKGKSIDLLIKIDDNLHGKVYLFYDGIKPKGFVLTSGNFTENGLVNNHEYGVCLENEEKQKEMADIIMSINTYDLSYIQLCEIYDDALKFIKKHPAVQQGKFKVHKLINKKPSVTQNGSVKYFLKSLGTVKEPFDKSRVIKDVDMFGFSKNPKKMQKGDVLLIHGVGHPSRIVAYYVVTSDEAIFDKKDDSDRWPWKIQAECHSLQFSAAWWNYELKTQELRNDFLEQNLGKHITLVGGDDLRDLQKGYMQITKEFAQFIINKIPG